MNKVIVIVIILLVIIGITVLVINSGDKEEKSGTQIEKEITMTESELTQQGYTNIQTSNDDFNSIDEALGYLE